MIFRIVAVAVLLLVVHGCGGSNQPSAAADTTPADGTASAMAGSSVTGRLAPVLATSSTLVALEPAGEAELPIKAEPAVMDQVSLVFYPSFLFAQTGQTVEFRNSEDVLHNVRVTEAAGQKPVFNIASPPYGKYEFKFERPGVYSVGCDIHSTMRADIFVTNTPYTAMTSSDGTFKFSDVQAGSYKLAVYAGPTPTVRPIEVKPGVTDLGVIQ